MINEPQKAVALNPPVQRDFVMLGNDIEGHRALLRQLINQGAGKVTMPIAWVNDLLTEIEQLRAASREMARVCGCLEPGEDGTPACEPYCLCCRIAEAFR